MLLVMIQILLPILLAAVLLVLGFTVADKWVFKGNAWLVLVVCLGGLPMYCALLFSSGPWYLLVAIHVAVGLLALFAAWGGSGRVGDSFVTLLIIATLLGALIPTLSQARKHFQEAAAKRQATMPSTTTAAPPRM
jgi:hypothetical protein